MNKVRLFFYFLVALYAPSNILSSDLNNFNNSQSAYGGVGLILNPTARMDEDGEFAFGVSTELPFKRLYAKVQFFPWMEAVVRYTEGEHKRYAGGPQSWKDKGIDLKFRLFNETNNFPQIALGFNDFGGTGAFSSEYLAATKRFNNLDFTLGLGWGKLGGSQHIKNPFGWFDDSYNTRGMSDFYGGTVKLGGLFTGPNVSFFGGVEYFTPIPNLSFKLEYNPYDYSQDIGRKLRIDEQSEIFEVDGRINYAFNYQRRMSQRQKVDFSLGYVRGNTLFANFTLHSNLNFAGIPKTIMGPEILKEATLEPFEKLDNDWKKYLTDVIIWQMSNQGFTTHNINFYDDEMQVEISQSRFNKPIHAIDLASRIVANNSPKNIKKITVINIDMGVETLRTSVSRDKLVYAVSKGALPEDYLEFNNYPEDSLEAVVSQNKNLYPNFTWNIKPHVSGTIQHQQEFYFWQLEALLHTLYSFKRGLYLTTEVGIDIANNFDGYTYHIPDGELYHVRQDRRLYLTEGETGLRRMQIDYVFSINKNLTAKVTGGILEWMYGGIGGEILYMPDDKPWAIGLDTYWLKQRNYDQKFTFLDYETVTAAANFYYDMPFYDLRLEVNAGRFLAKDKGATIGVSRRFKTGARIGARVALTDCDAACVGEGSFNKWIYFNLPMELFNINSTTRGRAYYEWSPLTKDAGQKVMAGDLYPLMKSVPDEIDIIRRKPWSIKQILSGLGTSPKYDL